MSNLASILTATAARHGQRPALKLDDTVLDYATFDELSARAAAMLAASGVGAGDRVALLVPNVPHFALAYFGALRLGAVVVPLNVLLAAREVEHCLRDSEASALMVWESFAGPARQAASTTGCDVIEVGAMSFVGALLAHEPQVEVAERQAQDSAVLLYTSGTTGRPKGADLSHDNLRCNVDAVTSMFTFSAEDVVLGALPLFHAFGQTCALNAAVRVGALLTLLPRFDAAKAVEVIERDRVTIFEGVPTMYAAMLQVADVESAVGSLRLCAAGGASLPVELLREFQERCGVSIYEGYGLSETSPIASFNSPHEPLVEGSIGRPIDGVSMRIVDAERRVLGPGGVGEIEIRGHNVMRGYWNEPQATSDALHGGWFRTGDLGRTDDEGRFYIVDRLKDLIIRGGYNVYPREVEEVLHQHPDVLECGVIALPHPTLGEDVGAAVVLRPGASTTAEELQAFVKERVAAYKYPRRVWFADELPKGTTGKILKRAIEPPVPDAPSSTNASVPPGGGIP